MYVCMYGWMDGCMYVWMDNRQVRLSGAMSCSNISSAHASMFWFSDTYHTKTYVVFFLFVCFFFYKEIGISVDSTVINVTSEPCLVFSHRTQIDPLFQKI